MITDNHVKITPKAVLTKILTGINHRNIIGLELLIVSDDCSSYVAEKVCLATKILTDDGLEIKTLSASQARRIWATARLSNAMTVEVASDEEFEDTEEYDVSRVSKIISYAAINLPDDISGVEAIDLILEECTSIQVKAASNATSVVVDIFIPKAVHKMIKRDVEALGISLKDVHPNFMSCDFTIVGKMLTPSELQNHLDEFTNRLSELQSMVADSLKEKVPQLEKVTGCKKFVFIVSSLPLLK